MNDLARNYASMPVEDIERLALDIRSLTPEARATLKLEMERRRLPADALDWTIQPELPKEQSGGVFRVFLRNFAIFFICDLIYMIVIGAIFSNVNGIDAEKLGRSLTVVFMNLSLLAAILTSRFLTPKSLKHIWIIGAFLPPFGFMIFILFR